MKMPMPFLQLESHKSSAQNQEFTKNLLNVENTIRGTRCMVATCTGQINFFPKTQVVVPVYDKMASIMPHS